MKENNLNYIFFREHKLFNGLQDASVEEIYETSISQSHKKGFVIYKPGQEIDKIFLLNRGRIKIVYTNEKGIEVVSEILKDGDVFGELSLKQSLNKHCEFAQVLSDDVFISSFSLKEFEKIMQKHNCIAMEFSKLLAVKLKSINCKFCDQIFKDARSRISDFFALHALHEGKWTGNKAEMKMLCNHHDIASFTGTSRQTVSAIIKVLIIENKIIYSGRNNVVIPDVDKLS